MQPQMLSNYLSNDHPQNSDNSYRTSSKNSALRKSSVASSISKPSTRNNIFSNDDEMLVNRSALPDINMRSSAVFGTL